MCKLAIKDVLSATILNKLKIMDSEITLQAKLY